MGKYWIKNGKYQEWVDKIGETMPDMYDTDNKYMNIFIAMSNVYYDIYNNGGCNLSGDCFTDRLDLIYGFVGKFDIRKAINDEDYLESITNKVFEKLMKEDLYFKNHGFWNEWKERKISMDKQEGENWIYISCGTIENVKKEFENRKNYGFEVV